MDRQHDDRHDVLRGLLLTRAALVQRARDTTCVRLCAGMADDVPGLLVDQFGPLVVAVDYATDRNASAQSLLRLVRDCLPGQHVVAKVRAVDDGSNRFATETFTPEAAALPLVGTELGLKFEIGTDPAHDFGLFLDAAKARAFVRGQARGRRVLNLFSYTGAFGVAAAVGGASDVTNVDPNRDYLAWSLRNAKLNDINMRVLPDTAQDFLAKHLRRLARDPQRPDFDLVIVDPPAFGVGRGNERVLRLLWPRLFESLRTMNPEQVLIMCNDKSFQTSRNFSDLVTSELGGYRFQRLGTYLTTDDLATAQPSLDWTASVEDPLYREPAVLVGRRSTPGKALRSPRDEG